MGIRTAGCATASRTRLHLVAQDGLFFPDGEKGQSFQLQAFGEGGKSPTASTPLIRVPVGTDVHDGREDVVLRADSFVQQWRAFAKDGANLPEWQATTRPARVHMGAGETTDFEFTPQRVGDLVLESTVWSLGIPVKIVKQQLLVQQTSP
jgi:hypothetical protein